MKYIKYFALAIGFFGLVACSDDKKDFNTSTDVMVEMPTAEITVKENGGMFNVPVEVTGNPNGIVTVTVKVEPTGDSPADEATIVNGNRVGHYIITSKTINIPADEKTASIQVSVLDNDEINDARKFIITIEKAEGAKIDESKKSTVVIIKDNDANPYDKLQGDWTISWDDFWGEGIEDFQVNLVGYEEGSANYGKVINIENLLTSPPYIKPADSTPLRMMIFYDEDTDECKVEIAYDQQIGTLNGDALQGYGGFPTYFVGLVVYPDGLGFNEGYIEGVVSEDRKVIQFNPDDLVGIYVDGGGLFFAGYELTLTKN